MSMETKTVYEFDRFRVDPQERLLLRGEKRIELTPKVFDLLLIFVRNSGRLLTKEELMASLWPDSHVDESNLKVNIGMLRKVLEEVQNGNQPKNGNQYIETIPKNGYRFLGDVRISGDPCPPENLLAGQPQDQNGFAPAELPILPEPKDQELPNAGSRHDAFLSFISRYPGWLLLAGIVTAIGSLVDLIFLHPQGAHLLRDMPGAIFAAFSVYCYIRASAKSLAAGPDLGQAAAFRGLVPFEPADAKRFYGRDIETAAIVEMVTHSEFLFGVLYGESGCGKTSLVRAGLIPRLEGIGYTTVHCRSYKDPLASVV